MIRPLSLRLTAPVLFQSNSPTNPRPAKIQSGTEIPNGTEPKAADGYHKESHDSLMSITSTDPTKARNTLRFGGVEQYQLGALACPSLVANTQIVSSPSPSEIGAEVFGYLKTYDRDIVGTDQMVDEAIGYVRNQDLACVFQSRAMTEVFENKNSYTTFDNLFDAISRRKPELISCLSLGQKFKYGLRIKGLLDRIELKKPILEGACRIYARHLGIKVGTAGADLIAYFFRRDKLSAQSTAIFDQVFGLLKTEAAKRAR